MIRLIDNILEIYLNPSWIWIISITYLKQIHLLSRLTLLLSKNDGPKKKHQVEADAEAETASIEDIKQKLEEKNIQVRNVELKNYLALPDDLNVFKKYFMDVQGNMVNPNRFKRRILGLVSYFRSAQEALMPRFNPASDIEIIKIPMSNEQFGIYNEYRHIERKEESNRKKNNQEEDASSTYRIFSRLACNFVFPSDIKRPLPRMNANVEDILSTNMDESDIDAKDIKAKINESEGRLDFEDKEEVEKEQKLIVEDSYKKRIHDALELLYKGKERYLSKTALQVYSPKFLQMIERLQLEGLHMIYSQFRTLEGIGIFRLVLLVNGFAEFKIEKNSIVTSDADLATKPLFVLYTGTETKDEKEIIRNVFNQTWEYVPMRMRTKLQNVMQKNNLKQLIRIFMITSSGAEGISLKNVNYVHIMEPYWHPVREEQVIGRARRICSHESLEEKDKFVRVFKYLMTFTREQLNMETSNELIAKDVSKLDKTIVVSTDEALDEIANIKKRTMDSILQALKEASIDCVVHASKENIPCFSFGNPDVKEFVYTPDFTKEEPDSANNQNTKEVDFLVHRIELGGKKYIMNIIKDVSKITHDVVRDANTKRFVLKRMYPENEPEPLKRVYRIRNKIISEDIYDNNAYENNNIVKIGKLNFTEEGKMRIVRI